MASALRISLGKISNATLKKVLFASTNTGVNHVIAPQLVSRGMTLSLSRNITSVNGVFQRFNGLTAGCSACQARKIHTEADGKLAEFLGEEISGEKKQSSQTLNKVEGWDTKTEGTGVILTKRFNNELIKIEFDVNDSVNEEPVYEPNDAEKPPNMVSRPPFEVEITKESGRKLTFMCEFNDVESIEESGEEDIEDQFNIVEVRVDEKTTQSGMENFYSHSSAVMDETLYDLLMDMLDERGIDDTFINNMVDFSTIYEHAQYVEFLEKLHSAIKEN